MNLIWMLIAGFVVGLVARAIKPGADSMGWILTIILGMVGAFVGGFIGSALGVGQNGGFMSFALSVVSAVIVLFVYEFATGKRRLR